MAAARASRGEVPRSSRCQQCQQCQQQMDDDAHSAVIGYLEEGSIVLSGSIYMAYKYNADCLRILRCIDRMQRCFKGLRKINSSPFCCWISVFCLFLENTV